MTRPKKTDAITVGSLDVFDPDDPFERVGKVQVPKKYRLALSKYR